MTRQKDGINGAEAPVVRSPVKFTKAQILKSKKYLPSRNVLAVILEDGREYGHEEIEAELNEFMKKKVK